MKPRIEPLAAGISTLLRHPNVPTRTRTNAIALLFVAGIGAIVVLHSITKANNSGNTTTITTKDHYYNDNVLDNNDDDRTEEENIRNCSSWQTYGNNHIVGGRRVMEYRGIQPGWKMPMTPEDCARSERCYPAGVAVEGVELAVKPGVHSFTIASLFPLDEFHVAMEGPELSPTFVEGHGNGTYTASYCATLPGFYKLYVRILQINGRQSLRKDVFRSPFSVRVREERKEEELHYSQSHHSRNESDQTTTLAALPDSCTTARQATQGRWVRFDHARHNNLLPAFELHRWEEVLEATRDEYVWLPYSCRLRPMAMDHLGTLFRNRTHCLCCDSYVRTLFSDAMLVLGVFTEEQYRQTRPRTAKLCHKNWEFEGVSMSWHDEANFERCLQQNRPDGLKVQSILVDPNKDGALSEVGGGTDDDDPSSSGKFVFFVGHPWNGDHLVNHRTNRQLQLAQRVAFLEIRSEIDIFDAFAFTFPRIYHEVCDASHVSCVVSHRRLTPLAFWEILILAQLM